MIVTFTEVFYIFMAGAVVGSFLTLAYFVWDNKC